MTNGSWSEDREGGMGGMGGMGDMGGSAGGGSRGSTRRTSVPVPRVVHDREVSPDWTEYPRYVADRGPRADGEPALRCVDCDQTAFELFHGRCTPCAIMAEIPLREKDRDAYAARVRAGMSAPDIRHVRPAPAPQPRLHWWQWRRWWPWAPRRRATDRTSDQ